MAGDNMRYYETFYGIHTDNWTETFGSFSDHHKLLVKEYLSEGCSCEEASTVSLTIHKFLYPHHIKKTYFIEGVIEGQITCVASSCSTTIKEYRVTVCKVHEDGTETELFTTGWRATGTYLTWDAAYSVGDEIVYPFWIPAWEKAKLSNKERIYVQVEVNTTGDSCCDLWYSNNSTWEDFKITLPLKM